MNLSPIEQVLVAWFAFGVPYSLGFTLLHLERLLIGAHILTSRLDSLLSPRARQRFVAAVITFMVMANAVFWPLLLFRGYPPKGHP